MILIETYLKSAKREIIQKRMYKMKGIRWITRQHHQNKINFESLHTDFKVKKK